MVKRNTQANPLPPLPVTPRSHPTSLKIVKTVENPWIGPFGIPLFYYNPDDPHLGKTRKAGGRGAGTLNFGHPLSWLMLGIMFLPFDGALAWMAFYSIKMHATRTKTLIEWGLLFFVVQLLMLSYLLFHIIRRRIVAERTARDWHPNT